MSVGEAFIIGSPGVESFASECIGVFLGEIHITYNNRCTDSALTNWVIYMLSDISLRIIGEFRGERFFELARVAQNTL